MNSNVFQKIAIMVTIISMIVLICSPAFAETGAENENAGADPAVITCSIEDINYVKDSFDYSEDIAAAQAAVALVPEAADISLQVTDTIGATGVELVGAEEENMEEYYLNVYIAGDTFNFTAAEGAAIVSAESSVKGSLENADGTVVYEPAPINIGEEEEVLTFTMEDGSVYRIHTIPERFPALNVTGTGVTAENAGVYTLALDRYMIRVNTEKQIIYYRNLNSVGEELMAENFAPQQVAGKQYYSMFVELRPEFSNTHGGYSSGMYIVLNENYQDIDVITLYPNDDPNHTHGEGYLDQHEFVVIDENHYLLLSYTLQHVENLPKNLQGMDGTQSTYVWAGILQEVRDGAVVAEINTADYPLLFESAVEMIDYANTTLDGIVVVENENEIFSFAEGIMDYVHVNSMDYTLNSEGNVDKLLVSMRNQCAVFQFDMASGALEWILGGKASTLKGYEEYTSVRNDGKGASFQALTYAQHFARYCNKSENDTIEGNPVISVFDNQTGMAPFITSVPIPTLTRVFKAEIDEAAGTATIFDVIEGTYMNTKTDKYHIASHCGSVQYDDDTSVVIGWGSHGPIDHIGPFAPEGTISDNGYDDLRIGSRPVVTEYDMINDEVTFELSANRNPLMITVEGFFSYSTYKTLE